jgi:hypothetical protein
VISTCDAPVPASLVIDDHQDNGRGDYLLAGEDDLVS